MTILVRFSKRFNNEDVVICDPCYLFRDDQDEIWQQAITEMYADPDSELVSRGTMKIGDMEILYSSTAYGDGVFNIGETRTGIPHLKPVGVDAGMVCVVALKDIWQFNPSFDYKSYSIIEGFNGIVEATGRGFIGDITLDTDDEEEDDV